MAVLGLLLLLSAAGLTLDVVFQNTSAINVDALGQTVTLSPGWLFVAGVVIGAVALLAVMLVLAGMARARRRRRALAESRNTAQGLQAERDRLAGALYHERAQQIPTADGLADLRGSAPATVEPSVMVPDGTSL